MAFFSPLSLFDVPVAPRRYCVVKRQPSLSDELNTLLTPFLLGDALCPKHKAKPKPRPAKWVECVQLPGFAPREVKAEVKGRKVVIVGKSVEGDGDNKNVYQVKRTVVVPPDVDASKVTCHYVPRRFVLVEGPRVTKTPQDPKPAVRVVPVSQPSAVDTAPCKGCHLEKKRKAEDAKTPDGSGDGEQPAEKRRCESEKPAESQEEREEAAAPAAMETAPAESEDKSTAAAPCQEGERTCDDTDDVSTRAEAGDCAMDVDVLDIEDEEEDDCSEEEQMVNILKPSAAGADIPPAAATTPTPTPAAPAAADATAVSKTTQSEPPARPAHFELTLNLTGFGPEDVKVSRDGSDVVIDAEHVEKRGECASRQVFHQVVTLPDNVDAEQLRSFLRDDGQLMITAPYCRASTDVVIPIRVE